MRPPDLRADLKSLLNEEDYRHFSAWRWRVTRKGKTSYVVRSEGRREILLHREILRAPPGSIVDHINGNGLDNRRENLRFATAAQNQHNQGPRSDNKTGYKGVFYNARTGRYGAAIQSNKRRMFLGLFATADAAHAAYCAAALLLHGEFARTEPFRNRGTDDGTQ